MSCTVYNDDLTHVIPKFTDNWYSLKVLLLLLRVRFVRAYYLFFLGEPLEVENLPSMSDNLVPQEEKTKMGPRMQRYTNNHVL